MIAWWPMQGSLPMTLYERVFGYTASVNFGVADNAKSIADPEFGEVCESTGLVFWQVLGGPMQNFLMTGTQTEASASWWMKRRNATPSGTAWGPPFCHDGDLFFASAFPYTDGNYYSSLFRAAQVSLGAPRADVDREQWHLITVTTKPGASGYTVYQNGMVQAQATGESTLPSVIWRSGILDSSEYYDGWLCDVRVWNRCLNEEEVYALWNPATRWDIYQRKLPNAMVDWASIRQSAFRFRNDDGSEAAATPLEDQDVHIERDREINTRLRVQVVSVDPDTSRYSLQYRKKGTSDPWRTVQP